MMGKCYTRFQIIINFLVETGNSSRNYFLLWDPNIHHCYHKSAHTEAVQYL